MPITPKQLEQIVLYAPVQTCVMAMGEPGVAKSAMMYRAAKRAGAVYVQKYTANMDAIDVRLPYLVETPDGRKFMEHAPPGSWPTRATEHKFPKSEIIVNLDDFGQAVPSVQKPIARAVYGDGTERMLGDYEVLPNVRFVGTSNRQEDRAGVHRFESYVANRLILVTVEADAKEWVTGAVNGFAIPEADEDYPAIRARINAAVKLGIPDSLIAFVAKFQQVSDFTPEAPAFMSPRSLETLGMCIRAFDVAGINGDILHEVACGTIGEAQAVKYMAFHKLRDEIPDVDAILNGEAVPLPPKSEVLFILATAILRAAKPEHIPTVAKFTQRLAECSTDGGMKVGVEVSTYFVRECLHGAGEGLRGLKSHPDFFKWLQKNGKYFTA